MLDCETSQSLMADALYLDDPDSMPKALSEHLDGCESCRNEFIQLQEACAHLDASGFSRDGYQDIPERASLDDMFDRLSPELDRIDAERFHQIRGRHFSPWSMAFGAIAASFVIFVTGFVFLSSNFSSSPVQPVNNVVSTDTSTELMNYLDRAQVMLMQVANTEQQAPVLPIQRTAARDLASEASLLTAMDNSPFASGERKLLRDIEFMLRQVANLDESNMEEGVALLQRFLEENGILFRIRLLEMRQQDLVI